MPWPRFDGPNRYVYIYITDNNKIDGKKYDMIGPVGHLLGDPNHIELAR